MFGVLKFLFATAFTLVFLIPAALLLAVIGLPVAVVLCVLALPVLIVMFIVGLPIFLVLLVIGAVVGVLSGVLGAFVGSLRVGRQATHDIGHHLELAGREREVEFLAPVGAVVGVFGDQRQALVGN